MPLEKIILSTSIRSLVEQGRRQRRAVSVAQRSGERDGYSDQHGAQELQTWHTRREVGREENRIIRRVAPQPRKGKDLQ